MLGPPETDNALAREKGFQQTLSVSEGQHSVLPSVVSGKIMGYGLLE